MPRTAGSRSSRLGTPPARAGRRWLVGPRGALTPGDDEDDDLGVTLVSDLERVWPNSEPEVATKTLLDGLWELVDAPWATFGRQGKGLTGKALANLLRPFGVKPGPVSVKAHHDTRGYRRAQFEDAWSRYCEGSRPRVPSVPAVPSLGPQGDSAPPKRPAESDPGTRPNGSDPFQDKRCDTWDTSEQEMTSQDARGRAPPGVEVDPETGDWIF